MSRQVRAPYKVLCNPGICPEIFEKHWSLLRHMIVSAHKKALMEKRLWFWTMLRTCTTGAPTQSYNLARLQEIELLLSEFLFDWLLLHGMWFPYRMGVTLPHLEKQVGHGRIAYSCGGSLQKHLWLSCRLRPYFPVVDINLCKVYTRFLLCCAFFSLPLRSPGCPL